MTFNDPDERAFWRAAATAALAGIEACVKQPHPDQRPGDRAAIVADQLLVQYRARVEASGEVELGPYREAGA